MKKLEVKAAFDKEEQENLEELKKKIENGEEITENDSNDPEEVIEETKTKKVSFFGKLWAKAKAAGRVVIRAAIAVGAVASLILGFGSTTLAPAIASGLAKAGVVGTIADTASKVASAGQAGAEAVKIENGR